MKALRSPAERDDPANPAVPGELDEGFASEELAPVVPPGRPGVAGITEALGDAETNHRGRYARRKAPIPSLRPPTTRVTPRSHKDGIWQAARLKQL